MPTTAPIPISTPPAISGPDCSWGHAPVDWLLLSSLAMAPVLK
jgi:hypothetical protein